MHRTPLIRSRVIHSTTRSIGALVGLFALAVGFQSSADAVPAYARQTGQDCIACHVGGFGPELTPFGRAFKLSGYTLQGANKKNVPLSAMLVASYTHTATPYSSSNPPPVGFSNNNNFTALQQASIFFAGRIMDHVGAFAQATYSDPGSQNLGWDNTEVRYAHDYQIGSTQGIFGVSVNNNPTLSDVWNTVPAWQFSYMSPPFGQSGPYASPLIYNLGQSVVGASAYTLVNNHWYGEIGLYHNLSTYWANLLHADNATLSGEAPYWRGWYSTTIGPNVYEVGVLGMDAKLNNGQPASAGTDHFQDVGVDASYQFLNGGPHVVTSSLIYMHERQNWDQSFPGTSDTLNNASVKVSYWYQQTYGATVSLFDSNGSADPNVYGDSATGSPNTSGAILEFDWNPFGKSWTNPEKNLRLGVQYTMYNKYLGARTNFDGAGTNARDMNTLFFYLWTAI